MTDTPEDTIGIADEPLSVRRRKDIERQQEIQDGLTSRHLSIATYRRNYLAEQFARVLGMRKG